jgi:PRTRC genetic system ThiF family protein
MGDTTPTSSGAPQRHVSRLSPGCINVLLVGAGGTGSHMLTALVQMHLALLALGHPSGLAVVVIDPDTVSAANVGRQTFFPADVGLPKAEVLITRVNMTYGLAWEARQCALSAEGDLRVRFHVMIGCVDNRAARKTMARLHERNRSYWLDCGNTDRAGQVVLGYSGATAETFLPHVGMLYPDAVDAAADAADDAPSCSLAEALDRQDLYINRAVALAGANLLWRLLREGELSHHGAFIDLANGWSAPLPVDEATWARLGYQRKRRARRTRASRTT